VEIKKATSEKHRRNRSGDAVETEINGAQQQQVSLESGDLAQLVWKHFEDEIRETLMEVQETLAAEQAGSSEQVRQERSYEK